MKEQTHILNRAVIFTEVPGNVKFPAGTRLTVKKGPALEHDVVAIVPTGQRYEFKSFHITNLLRTPWVDSVDLSEAVEVPTTPPVEVNPFTIGDVASVEQGLNQDTLPPMDVTGASNDPNPKAVAVVEAPAEAEDVTSVEQEALPLDVTEEGTVSDVMADAIDVTGSSNEVTPVTSKKNFGKKSKKA